MERAISYILLACHTIMNDLTVRYLSPHCLFVVYLMTLSVAQDYTVSNNNVLESVLKEAVAVTA
jgi:hypothetical protein